MARHTFFSFHYVNDVMRAQVIKNAWVTQDRVESGFFDKSAFEKAQIESPDNLKRFLTSKLEGTSVTCVCVGAQTFARPWVRYEIMRSVQQGKGLLGVKLDQVKCAQSVKKGLIGYERSGANPFDQLGIRRNDGRLSWIEWKAGKWVPFSEVPSVAETDVPYQLGSKSALKLSELFAVYDYNPSIDHLKIGQWIENAAKHAGR
ncbi:MAG: TIR domain-containing protein [bacterium]